MLVDAREEGVAAELLRHFEAADSVHVGGHHRLHHAGSMRQLAERGCHKRAGKARTTPVQVRLECLNVYVRLSWTSERLLRATR